jgi:hypothetical protein
LRDADEAVYLGSAEVHGHRPLVRAVGLAAAVLATAVLAGSSRVRRAGRIAGRAGA